MNKTVAAGVSVVLVVVFALVGVGVLDSAELTNVLTVDSQAEWQNNGTLTNLTATAGGELQLAGDNLTGDYVSNNFANASDATIYSVRTSIPEPGNSSVTLTVDGTDYDLSSGSNRVSVTGGSNFELSYERDGVNVTSPSVDSVSVLAGDTGSLLRLVALAAFGLLLLLVVVNYLGVDLNLSRGSGY